MQRVGEQRARNGVGSESGHCFPDSPFSDFAAIAEISPFPARGRLGLPPEGYNGSSLSRAACSFAALRTVAGRAPAAPIPAKETSYMKSRAKP